MDNKLSELSKPVAYKFDHGVMGPGDFKYGTPQMHSTAKDENASPLYSQEYVSAMLSQIEADREIKARLCRESNRLHDVLKAAEKRIAELEGKLATPVRLKKVDSSNVPFAGDGFNAAVDYCAKAVRAAGFTIEGDE